MNEALDYDGFGQLVAKLWPDYKTSKDLLTEIWRSVRRHSADKLAQEMRAHRHNEPDAKSPKWKTIINALFEYEREECVHSPLEILLNIHRRLIERCWKEQHDRCRECGWKPSAEWSDQDLWQNFLDAKTRPITHDAKGLPLDDPDGRRAQAAALERKIWANLWQQKLDRAGATVPYWMSGDPSGRIVDESESGDREDYRDPTATRSEGQGHHADDGPVPAVAPSVAKSLF